MFGLGWSWRALLWIGLALVAGAPCAFLALETIGIPVAGLTLALLVVVGHRNGILPDTLVAFGLSYAAIIAHFAVPHLVDAIQASDSGNIIYAVTQLTSAGFILAAGWWLLAKRRRGAPDRAA